MTDEETSLDKPIVLPEVSLVLGYKVICADPKCGRVGFEPSEEDAEAKRQTHLDAHLKHEKSMREKLAALLGDEEIGESGPMPSLNCPSSLCKAPLGFAHVADCDVAVCLSTGAQRKMRDHVPANDPAHECGNDVWTGYYSGEPEALTYGVPVRVLKTLGVWDEATLRWVLPEGWEKAMHERNLGPKIQGM